MEKIIVGQKDNTLNYAFRETCFGICIKNSKVLVAIDSRINKYSFIGGGVEKGETIIDALKREFLEESGLSINNIRPFVTIDCYWMAEDKYPLNSLAHFYIIDIEKVNDVDKEFIYEYVDPKDIDFPLPYQRKALELICKI